MSMVLLDLVGVIWKMLTIAPHLVTFDMPVCDIPRGPKLVDRLMGAGEGLLLQAPHKVAPMNLSRPICVLGFIL